MISPDRIQTVAIQILLHVYTVIYQSWVAPSTLPLFVRRGAAATIQYPALARSQVHISTQFCVLNIQDDLLHPLTHCLWTSASKKTGRLHINDAD